MGRLRAEIRLRRCAAPGLVLACVASIACASEPSPSAPGAADYAAHCANCHGAQLQGGVHASPLIGPVFDQNWTGKRARMLYSRIISTMPQNDPGTLTVPEALAVTLYVFTANGITFAGHTPSSPDELNTLTIPHGAAALESASSASK
jgi:mono/diheme cytochrome c family protein